MQINNKVKSIKYNMNNDSINNSKENILGFISLPN